MKNAKKLPLAAAICFFALANAPAQAATATGAVYQTPLPADKKVALLLDSDLAWANGQTKIVFAEDETVSPFLKNERTMVPLRIVSESLGAEVAWKADTRTAEVKKGDSLLRIQIGSAEMQLGGAKIALDAPAELNRNVTFVPLRAVFEAFGKSVGYKDGLITVSDMPNAFSENEKDQLMDKLGKGKPYAVYQNGNWLKGFSRAEDAEPYARLWANASIQTRKGDWLWNNYPPYRVDQNKNKLAYFNSYSEAVDYAKKWANSHVYWNAKEIWTNAAALTPKKIQGVLAIYQNPELPRGCEVTSLAMLLQYYGIAADKMDLADAIDKVPFSSGGYNGNPNDGFVGDIYSFSNSGYGVYHAPIARLAEKYAPGKVVDMTGSAFDDVLRAVSQGHPVWVINNVYFSELPDSEWRTWYTSSGAIDVTYKEHSVLVTGFDENYVYMNDPLGNASQVERGSFEAAWVQMGSQAIALFP